MKSNILAVCGFIMVVMGGIGLFVPVWPTTPFVLLAAGCFSSHPRLRRWLEGIGLFRAFILNHEQRCGLPRRTVISSICFLWIMLGFSILRFKSVPIALGLALVGCAVTVHILYISKPRHRKDR